MLAYEVGSYDMLREDDLEAIDQQIQLSREQGIKNFGIGIYDDNVCQALNINKPIKSLEDRMEIMKYIRGVDFVFPVHSLDKKILEKEITKAYEEFKKQQNKPKKKEDKKYDLAYAPGTYDLFHAGHLENLLIASSQSKRLIVGVKADKLVQQHKNKSPMISQKERVDILRHFKFVDDAYIYFTRDLDIANDYIKSKYDKDVDAVFLGSDLKNDFKDVKNINIVYTERDEKLMEERSSTGYAKKYKKLRLSEPDKKRYTGDAKGLTRKQIDLNEEKENNLEQTSENQER